MQLARNVKFSLSTNFLFYPQVQQSCAKYSEKGECKNNVFYKTKKILNFISFDPGKQLILFQAWNELIYLEITPFHSIVGKCNKTGENLEFLCQFLSAGSSFAILVPGTHGNCRTKTEPRELIWFRVVSVPGHLGQKNISARDGCWSTHTFTNSYFGQLVPNKLVLYFSLVNSYFMPLVNSYFLIGQLVLFD